MLDHLKNLVTAFLRQAGALLRRFLDCVEAVLGTRVQRVWLPHSLNDVATLAKVRKWTVRRRFQRPAASRFGDSEGLLLRA